MRGLIFVCTSFIFRGDDTIIGMNFDNNGMKYAIDTKNPKWFFVLVDGGRRKYPSFGVDSSGRFFNNLVVDSNGKGLYKRVSKKVTNTTKLITDILKEAIQPENLDEYLTNIEVVNTPDLSCHNMICDSNANVWVVEPGRGIIKNSANSLPFFIMTNFSLWDYMYENAECKCSRYNTVSSGLENVKQLNIEGAFNLLEAASQRNGEWITSFSMVYSKKSGAVYYCFHGNFSERFEYKFPT
jgi:hypothetical protein